MMLTMIKSFSVEDDAATVFVRGRGPEYSWECRIGEESTFGSAVGDPEDAMAAGLAAAKQMRSGRRHRGQIFAAHDRRTGEGRVLEAGKGGKLFDSGLKFESQGAAEEYVAQERARSADGEDTH